MKQKNKFANWLTARHQIVIRNEENLAEKTTLSFSNAKLIILGFITLLLFILASLMLSHTLLRKLLNPAYIEQENANKLVKISKNLKKLENQNEQQDRFIKLFQSIIDEKKEIDTSRGKNILELQPRSDNTTVIEERQENIIDEDILNYETNVKSFPDSLKKKHDYFSTTSYPAQNKLLDIFLISPLEGVITTSFNLQTEHYGVDIVGKENEPIKSIADGTVIFSTWTVETGWVIGLQHRQNLISIYKHNATLFKKIGNLVKSGEVVGIMGNSGEFSSGPHLHFELWYEGNPVDPKNFISF